MYKPTHPDPRRYDVILSTDQQEEIRAAIRLRRTLGNKQLAARYGVPVGVINRAVYHLFRTVTE